MAMALKSALRAKAAALALVLSSAAAMAGSAYEGTWKVTDTAGKPFEIVLAADGSAKATQGAGLSGTWKEEGGAAVITWSSGWTTKIAKDGAGYKKTAFAKGAPLDGAPTNSSSAEKAK